MKGDNLKKKKSPFKKGNEFRFVKTDKRDALPTSLVDLDAAAPALHNPPPEMKKSRKRPPAKIIRYDEPMFKKIAKTGGNNGLPVSIPAADGSQGPAMILRPRRQTEQQQETPAKGNPVRENCTGMLFVDKEKLLAAINGLIQQHKEQSPKCDDLLIDVANYLPWGMSCRLAFRCVHCDVISDRKPMYEHIDTNGRGPKAARPNMGLQFGLQDTPISNERARLLLAYTGMRPGSRSGMQKNANQAGNITAATNTLDLQEKIQELKEVNKARGLGEDAPLIVEFDVRYGGMRMNNSYRPGQGASDAVGLLVENVTSGKSIIGVYVENKLCYRGAWLRKQGHDVTCPGHDGCTATIPYSDLISEKKIAAELGRQLAGVHNLLVSHLTTDSDAKGPSGIEEAMREFNPDWEVEKMKDLTHLGRNQRRFVVNASFSKGMFLHVGLAPLRKKAQEALANDLVLRCAIAHKELFRHYLGDEAKIAANVYRAVDCILDCYNGQHNKCRNSSFSFTCKGTKGNTWFEVSHHLKGFGVSHFQPNDEDMTILRQAISMKLGKEALKATKLRTSTQGCESRNAGFSVSLPRNRRHARNVSSRAHSTVLRLNNGPRVSMEMKMRAGKCEITSNSAALKVFQQQQHRQEYSCAYKQKPEVRKHAMHLRGKRVAGYYDGVRERHNEVEYCKFQLDKVEELEQKVEKRCKAAMKRSDRASAKRHVMNPKHVAANAKVRKAKKQLLQAEKRKQDTKYMNALIRASRNRWQKGDHIYASKK